MITRGALARGRSGVTRTPRTGDRNCPLRLPSSTSPRSTSRMTAPARRTVVVAARLRLTGECGPSFSPSTTGAAAAARGRRACSTWDEAWATGAAANVPASRVATTDEDTRAEDAIDRVEVERRDAGVSDDHMAGAFRG